MDRKFEHVAVLKGGPSAEREVSLRSGAAVGRGLREAGYRVTEVDVTSEVLPALDGVDAVFIALHGTFGEDGRVQAMLRERGLPFTGAGPEASRLAFDKALCKDRLTEHGVPVAAHELVADASDVHLPLPLVVKPARQGSTIGISCVRDPGELGDAIAEARRYDEKVLAEAYIPGRELTVGIVDGDVLPIVEVRTPDDWYSYDAKYISGNTEYRVPADVSEECADRCVDHARIAFEAVGCVGLARVDFRMTEQEALYCLEVNTIPGFTETSLLPKAAAHAGIAFSTLCDRIMRTAGV